MAFKGKLSLRLEDVRGKGLRERVVIELEGRSSSVRTRNVVDLKTGRVTIRGIDVVGDSGVFGVRVTPTNYRPAQFHVRLEPGETTHHDCVLPVDPNRVLGIESRRSFVRLDPRLKAILNASTLDEFQEDGVPLAGEALWDVLDPARKAALLNIFTKASETPLSNGTSVADHLGGLVKLRRDRFFARTSAVLREEAANTVGIFEGVSGSLHHAPDPAYVPARSFKTRDRYGNLQLSFFRKGLAGDDYLVDVDIDEASGIEHYFEVARNALVGHKTHPYDIREILIAYNRIDPGYDFVLA